MKNTLKRLLSLLLVLSMVVSLVPAAFATETTGETEAAVEVVTEETTAPAEESSVELYQDSTEEVTEATEEVTEATEEVTEATEEVTEATEEVTEATEEVTEATEEVTEATEEATEATEEVTEATEETTEATEEATEATEEATEPVEETTEATDGVLTVEDVDTAAVAMAAGLGTADALTDVGMVVISQTNHDVASGVSYNKIFTRNASNQQTIGFLTEVDLTKSVALKASYKGYYKADSTADSRKQTLDSLAWGLQTTTSQASAYESAADTVGTVVMATNGDYFNMQTGQPTGYLIMEGNVKKAKNEPYFAILTDGTAVIRDAGTDHSDVVEAISGPFYLVKNGEIAVTKDTDLMPRNSVGIREDGSVVFFQADGRQAPTSVGLTLYETASVLVDAGCVTALYLDGGGSATVAARAEGTDDLVVINSPSDGIERDVSSAILIVSTADSDGIFHHASLYPKNEVYTPGSTIEFTAVGADHSGGTADLPETGLTWHLEDASAGTIDAATGVFTAATGFVGDVNVYVQYNGGNVGSTNVVIAAPDELYFTGTSISLDFGETSDLGLNVKYLDRVVNYKDGDFVWTITSTKDGVDAEKIGTIENNLFTSGINDSTMTADVTVSYVGNEELTSTISVEVGKMPVVYLDFEPNEDGRLTAAHYHWGKSDFVDNGTNTDGGYIGSVSPITVKTSGTYTGNTTTAELTAPYRFTGNWDTSVPAADIFHANGYEFYLWPNGTLTEYLCGEAKIVTEAEGGQVRFGEYALELDYDYESYDGSKNANYYLRYCGDPIYIEGYPTELGVWVYAPEGTANFQLYADIGIWNGSDYTTKLVALTDANTGINWEGWRYCSGSLVDFWTYQNEEHPLAIIPGNGGVLWLSYQPGKGFGGRYNGTLYFDNMRLVYGTNLDDLDNPVINSVTVNGTSLAEDGSTLIDTGDVEIVASYQDYTGANCSGIQASATTISVDGVVISSDNSISNATTRTTLSAGKHVLTVRVYDNFGNYTEKRREFVIGAEEAATVSVDGSDIISMGGSYVLEVNATGNMSAADVTILRLNSDFGEPVIAFADGVEGTYTYTEAGFKKATLKMQMTMAEAKSGTLATITFDVPADMDPESDYFTYTVSNISYTTASGETCTTAQTAKKLTLTAFYTITADIQVVGKPCVITVTDPNGAVCSGVTVLLNGEELGVTDANGQITTEAMAAMNAGTTCILTATGEDGVSFETSVTVMAGITTEEKFQSIHITAAKDGSTQKEIKWFANPLSAEGKAILQYRVEGETAWTKVEGTAKIYSFGVSANAAYVNSVSLSNLTPGLTYEFQVGDGTEDWSDIYTFTTEKQDAATKFFVVGDTQMNGDRETDAEAIQYIKNMGVNVDSILGNAAFGLQTGDFVDNGGNYTMWEEILTEFCGGFDGIDIVHTFGNHEYYGDLSGVNAASILSSHGANNYSVEYDNVYVAVIHNGADLEEAAQWLIEDAKASSCTWKILSVHQPAYYTNPSGGSSSFHAVIPDAAEAAGIDVVFSGHDHSYARTESMIGGEVAKNGITYFISGDLGEKSRSAEYAAVNNADFNFAKISQDYAALCLMVEANELSMTIRAYDVPTEGDATEIDSVTIYTTMGACDANGHELENAVYDRSTGEVICNNCGMAVDPVAANYTDWATDKETGRKMYLISGEPQTGAFIFGEDTYYFDEEGVALDGKVEWEEVEMEFDNGTVVGGHTGFVTKKDGKLYHYENGAMTHGWLQDQGDWYYMSQKTGEALVGKCIIPDDSEALFRNARYDFAEDGKLVGSYFSKHGYFFWAGEPVLTSFVKNAGDTDPDAWYGTNEIGHFVTDGSDKPTVKYTMDGVVYTFNNSNGKLLKGGFLNEEGKLYYYWAGEAAKDGWIEIEGEKYYAFEDGHLATGSHVIDGEAYMFNSQGKLVTDGVILTAVPNKGNTKMLIKVTNAKSVYKMRLAVWPVGTQQNLTIQWFDAKQNEDKSWTVEIPMCIYNRAGAYNVHVYATAEGRERVLVTSTFEASAAVTHEYVNDICKVCGGVRAMEIALYRLYNPYTLEHLLTSNTVERDDLLSVGWELDGIAWNSPNTGDPVYRLYNTADDWHTYSANKAEVDMMVAQGWVLDGVVCYSAKTNDARPVYRLFNPFEQKNYHMLTASKDEKEFLEGLGWKLDGIAWQCLAN